jgi:hypothetical protein
MPVPTCSVDVAASADAAATSGAGADGIGLIAKLLRELYRATLHNITTHEASIDGDYATGTTYCLAYHMTNGDGDGGTLETLGVKYEEQFIRTAEGWRFTVRDATRLWSQITLTPFEPRLIDRAASRVTIVIRIVTNRGCSATRAISFAARAPSSTGIEIAP